MNTQDNRKKVIVVIDDDEAARISIGQMFMLRGYDTKVFASAESALSMPDISNVECIVTDVKMPGMDGEELLVEVISRGVPSPVIMITGHGDISMAVRCLKAGAYDFVEKPFEDEVLLACVKRAVENSALKRESRELKRRLERISPAEDGRFNMIGKSRAMLDLYEQIEVVARSNAPVLITGETGTGKELVAQAIHDLSLFSSGSFVPVNAGALPETMLESELFGHAKGAFTGAITQRDGKLVTASGGTLLLDEAECLSIKAQIELLRVLEDGFVHPLGA
ncbi:MAG: sigma-54-dependent Fis family transcriptional regulator, partial [Spirochaetota bacterium]